jgi:hypothetical protein
MPARVTPQECIQSASDSSSRRVVAKARVSCWRRPAAVSLGTRMVTSTPALAISRPATRSANSGSSCTSCIDDSYDERRSDWAAAARGSQGHREIWSAGSKHHSAALEGGSRRQTVRRGQARQGATTSAGDRGPSLPDHPHQRRNTSRDGPADASAAAPGAAGPPTTAGQPHEIFTPQRRHLKHARLLGAALA